MNYLLILPRSLWKILFILNFVLGLLLLYPIFYFLLSDRRRYPVAFKLMKFWAHWIMYGSGLFVKIKRELPAGTLPQNAVYCANHASYLDIVLGYFVIPNYFVSMGKQEIKKAPLFRIFFNDMNILVNRKSNVGSHKAFLRAAQEIDKGHGILLYPEGGISSNGSLLPFKNGAFKLAIEKQIPVVPITFLNNWKHLQNGGFLKANGKPGVCRVIVHQPISTIGMNENDLLPLKTHVRTIILNELNRYHSENRK